MESENVDQEEFVPAKTKKVTYKKDPQLPSGWRYYDNGRGAIFFRDSEGTRFSSRRRALAHMYKVGGFTKEAIYYIRDGLLDEGWFYHQDLPPSWMYKLYNHKIEGVNTDILYILSPGGTIFRSKIKIKRQARELGLTDNDLKLILDFKNEVFEPKKVDDPDSDWIYDEDFVPEGWRMKRYSYNSGVTKKKEEVFHYLTPDNMVLRGRKQVYDHMVKSGTFDLGEFKKFHFNRKRSMKSRSKEAGIRRRNPVDWTEWEEAEDLDEGWKSRYCYYRKQRKVQYKAPNGKKFQSKVLAIKYITSGDCELEKALTVKTRRVARMKEDEEGCGIRHRGTFTNDGKYHPTVWGEWKSDEIPCLSGWQFSIGRRGSKRIIRYKSPKGDVFKSRGPLLRYLHNNGLKSKDQLAILKKQLKTNQGLHVNELLKNDKFIKNFDADLNYLEFLKNRYESDTYRDYPEVVDPKLPEGWLKKVINGVDYFKDPTGHHVFNSRKLVIDHLRRNYYDLTYEYLQSILNDSDSDSDLTDSEDDSGGPDNEENNNKNSLQFVSC